MTPELLRALRTDQPSVGIAPDLRRLEGPDSEYGLLKEVLLASPRHLSIVPCNRVSEDALEQGRSSCSASASRQHRALLETLLEAGVRVRTVQPAAGLPDLAFTRDTSLMTPWGLIGLRPGIAHRRREVDVVLDAACAGGIPILGRVTEGSVEGGDVCLLRPGHLVVGVSEERTTTQGARALGRFFEQRGWTVTLTPVDPDLLHLDTHFCVIDRDIALACVEKLDADFVRKLEQLGIRIVPVRAEEIASLGCNVLSLGNRRIISTGSAPRVDEEVRKLGFEVLTVGLGEFTQCGGGVHCLTMPLRRQPAAR
ncbi:dimethylarginine dimethylaminohydrolase family protein [Sphingomonas sp. LHG3406-1]|uniref:dimethylarginine dimethylaminohydrolase family protein n=1 Tax=Sphingomonas sp. LHG3406-1 TaxID=2804617 RepID=UPI0026162503|nr:arginine deiminase family protein [Sphingomonas sp. LHG3406-1]